MNAHTEAAAAGTAAGPLDDWLHDRARERDELGLRRELRPMRGPCVDLASNDYLGLSRDPRVMAATHGALDESGFDLGDRVDQSDVGRDVDDLQLR